MTRTAGQAEAPAAAALLQGLLPPELLPLFDASFVRLHLLYDEFIHRLVLRVVSETGLEQAVREPGTTTEIATRAGFAGTQALVPLDWMLRLLTARGLLEELSDGAVFRYRSLGPFPTLDPAPMSEEQKRLDASWMPAYTLAETVARDYPAFLGGEVTGEEVLFAPRRLRLWIDYFSNDNGLYVVNNRLGALAVEQWLPRAGGVVLELGGGLGSGALALLERLEATGRLGAISEYRFTELVPAFLRRGEQALRTRHPRAVRRDVRVSRHEPPVRGAGGGARERVGRLCRQHASRGPRPGFHTWRSAGRSRAGRPPRRVRVRALPGAAGDRVGVRLQPDRDVPIAAAPPALPTERRIPHARAVERGHGGRRIRRHPLSAGYRAGSRASAEVHRCRDRSNPSTADPRPPPLHPLGSIAEGAAVLGIFVAPLMVQR